MTVQLVIEDACARNASAFRSSRKAFASSADPRVAAPAFCAPRASTGSPAPGPFHRKASARRAARRPDARFSLRCADRGRASEHAVVVGRFLRNLLDDIPVLDDLAILEAEEVHKRSSRVFWIVGFEIDIRMGCDEIALRDDSLDL